MPANFVLLHQQFLATRFWAVICEFVQEYEQEKEQPGESKWTRVAL